MKKQILAIVAVAALATPAMAQSFNSDSGTVFGLPSSLYGAAAGPAYAGTWNSHGPAYNPVGLNGVALAGVNVTSFGGFAGFSFNNPGTIGDDQALMDDGIDGTHNVTVTGLSAGTYNVFTYAWAPDSAAAFTNVSVNGQPNQLIGGAWPGGHQQGVTYALHTVNLLAGQSINIVTSAGISFSTFNGFQIALVPGPAGLAMLGMGLLASRRRRN